MRADPSVAEQTLLAVEANLKGLRKHRDWLHGGICGVGAVLRNRPMGLLSWGFGQY